MRIRMNHPSQLHKAIESGDVSEVRSLMEDGADLDHVFGMRGTPLCAAISANQPDIAQCLLEAGCDVNARDYDGEPPLCLGIRKLYKPLVQMLINHPKCDLNKVDPITGNTPLMVAIRSGSAEVISWLLSIKSCCVNQMAGQKQTYPVHEAIRQKNLAALQLLLDAGCSLHLVDFPGYLPIHLAAKRGNPAYLDMIMKYYKDTPETTPDGSEWSVNSQQVFTKQTPLHMAAKAGNCQNVRTILKYGCQLEIKDHKKQTALCIACMHGHIDVVETLLHAGADPNNYSIMQQTLYAEGTTAPLFCAIESECKEIVHLLVSHGVDLTVQNEDGYTFAHFCFRQDRVEMVEEFLKLYPDRIDPCICDRLGNTCLYPMCACDFAGADLGEKILELGCPINQKNINKELVIHEAVNCNRSDIVIMLLHHGVYVNEPDLDGCTPLHLAIIEGSRRCVAFLLQFGADVRLKPACDESVIRLAIESNNPEIAMLLMEGGVNGSLECLEYQKSYSEDYIPECFEDEEEFFHSFVFHGIQPLSLMALSRNTIREHIIDNGIPFLNIKKLPVPQTITDYLLMRDIGDV